MKWHVQNQLMQRKERLTVETMHLRMSGLRNVHSFYPREAHEGSARQICLICNETVAIVKIEKEKHQIMEEGTTKLRPLTP